MREAIPSVVGPFARLAVSGVNTAAARMNVARLSTRTEAFTVVWLGGPTVSELPLDLIFFGVGCAVRPTRLVVLWRGAAGAAVSLGVAFGFSSRDLCLVPGFSSQDLRLALGFSGRICPTLIFFLMRLLEKREILRLMIDRHLTLLITKQEGILRDINVVFLKSPFFAFLQPQDFKGPLLTKSTGCRQSMLPLGQNYRDQTNTRTRTRDNDCAAVS
jgi:hypothetical protein